MICRITSSYSYTGFEMKKKQIADLTTIFVSKFDQQMACCQHILTLTHDTYLLFMRLYSYVVIWVLLQVTAIYLNWKSWQNVNTILQHFVSVAVFFKMSVTVQRPTNFLGWVACQWHNTCNSLWPSDITFLKDCWCSFVMFWYYNFPP